MDALLLSNSTNFGASYMEHAKDAIAAFLGDIKEILFVPYAGVTVSYDDYTKTVQKALAIHDIKVLGIHSVTNPQEAIKQAKAIAIGGGNTFRLVERLQNLKLMELIHDEVNSGTAFIGWSAGSNVAGPTLCTTNDMPIIEPPSFQCLGLVPYQINPHYSEATIANHGGESRKARLMEYITLSQTDVVCLPEGSWINIDKGVSSYHGEQPMKVYRGPNQVLYFEPTEANSYFK
jgi:dipeptidase E